MKKVVINSCLLLSLSSAAAHVGVRRQQPAVAQRAGSAAPAEDELATLNRIAREIDAKVRAARERGGFYAELNALRALETEYAAQGEAAHGAIATMLLQASAEAGNYADAIRYGDVVNPGRAPAQPPDGKALEGFRAVPALGAITRAAVAAQVVIINEAHHVPQHRAFSVALLKSLRREGFNYFAAETIFESDAKLNERGYPTRHTGAYTNEPVYGDLVRTALRLGYRVVPYEAHDTHSIDERERGQATNLRERIFRADPRAKVLVHVGYGHNSEAARGTGKLMAGYLKEFTGIDPLTVDQTLMSEHSAPDYEHPLYRYATSRGLVSRPVVFRNDRGELFAAQKGVRDVTLFSPRSVYENGRPTWLKLDGARKPHRLPRDVCAQAARCLVSARAAEESADAVPVDRVEVSAAAPPALMLPRGEFVVEAVDAEGKKVKEFRVKGR